MTVLPLVQKVTVAKWTSLENSSVSVLCFLKFQIWIDVFKKGVPLLRVQCFWYQNFWSYWLFVSFSAFAFKICTTCKYEQEAMSCWFQIVSLVFKNFKISKLKILSYPDDIFFHDFFAYNWYLKGQCPEIFNFWFFSRISFPQSPEYTMRAVSNFFENSRRYSQLKVANAKNLQS